MGKKRLRSKYISKGERNSVATNTKRLVRADYMNSPDRMLNQQSALFSGKDIVVTLPNPNKEETNRLFIKQRISGKEYLKARVA